MQICDVQFFLVHLETKRKFVNSVGRDEAEPVQNDLPEDGASTT